MNVSSTISMSLSSSKKETLLKHQNIFVLIDFLSMHNDSIT